MHHRGGFRATSADAMMGVITAVLRDHGSESPNILIAPGADGTEGWVITISYDHHANSALASDTGEKPPDAPSSRALTDVMVDLVLGAD
jgi:hypothetical protein